MGLVPDQVGAYTCGTLGSSAVVQRERLGLQQRHARRQEPWPVSRRKRKVGIRAATCYHLTMATVALILLLAGASAADYFGVSASFVPAAKPGADAAVTVTFAQRDPEVRINEDPAPRLKLDPEQAVLVDKQPPAKRSAPVDLAKAKYLDTTLPVAFPVVLSPKAARGPHEVPATVVYFYCSKRDGWCRKGSSPISIPVVVP
jgi:hypothetical protein